MIYNFQILNRQISTDNIVLVADNTTDTANFIFDGEWEGLVKTVRFQQGTAYTDIVLSNDVCIIPRLDAGTLYIGVFAGDLHTSAPCCLTVGQSILSCSGSPAAPEDDVYAQLMEYVADTCAEYEADIAANTEASQAAQSAAETAEGNAEASEIAAETAQAAAEAAADNALNAQTAAETAQTAAETAQTAAELAETNAEIAETNAREAQTAAEAAEANAETAQAAASASALAASGSAVSADTSADEAALSALSASESATAAAESESNAATVAEETAQAVVDNKLDIDGYSALARVGTADNLAGKGDGVDAEYIYRTTGGSADVADGTATIKSIKGNTIVWNQLVDIDSVTIRTITGHKYYYYDADGTPSIIIGDGTQLEVAEGTDMLFDLTRMFSAGNEPSTVAEFRALFPKDYYEYDAGSLLSFVGNGIKTVGFNLFDEETKLMAVDGATKVGDYYSFPANKWHVAYTNNTLIDIPTDYIGQIEVKMNAYASNTTAIPQVVFKYADGTKSYESFARTTTPTDYTFISTEGKRVVAVSGAYYANGTVYVKDFCIHLVWSGYRNGEYEDYWTQTRNLPTATYFPNGMRSAGDAYDELTASKAITRISVKVLDGTETIWLSSTTDSAKKRFLINCENAKRQGNTNKNIICNYYTARSNGNTYNCNVGISPYDIDGRIVIYDDRYTTIDDFKAYLAAQNAEGNPVILYYEVATPTEVAISPELNLSYLVSDFGTEEITTADNVMTAPCNMDVVYGLNAADTIRRLPENYVATAPQTLTATQKTQILANLGISDAAHMVSTPASSSATGTVGSIAYDDEYLYICTALNTWKRTAVATW